MFWVNHFLSCLCSILFLLFWSNSDVNTVGPRLDILLDSGELLHPGHPAGEVGVLIDHPWLHQPHQVHDCVQCEVRVGRGIAAEEALITQHLHQGRELVGERLGKVILLLLLPLVPLVHVDNWHDPVEVLSRLVKSIRQGSLHWVLGDEVRLGDKPGQVAVDGARLADDSVVHLQDRELTKGELARTLPSREVSKLHDSVSVGDPAIGHDHTGRLSPGSHGEVDKGKLRSHDFDLK